MNWHNIFNYVNGHIYWKDGQLAETKHSAGYLQVYVNNQLYLVHRIIWEMHNGPIPVGFIIDHNDHNRINNFPDNLNLVTYGTNQKNRTKNYNNSSGFTGVGWDSVRQKWRADIKYQGKSINLGRFDNMQDAINMRLQIEHDLGFNPNHGK